LSQIHKITDNDPFTSASMYFASGGGVNHADATKEVFGHARRTGSDKAKELKWVTAFKPEASLPTVASVAHSLWEEGKSLTDYDYTDHDYRNALIEVMRTYKNVTEIRSDLINNVDKYKKDRQKYEEEYGDYLKEQHEKLTEFQKLKIKYNNLKSSYKQLQEENKALYSYDVPF